MIGSGSIPASAMRPAKTETQHGAPSLSGARDHLDLRGVNSAVTLTLTPASESSRTSGASDSPVVVVTGNLHVDVVAPGRDHARLPADVVRVVGERPRTRSACR